MELIQHNLDQTIKQAIDLDIEYLFDDLKNKYKLKTGDISPSNMNELDKAKKILFKVYKDYVEDNYASLFDRWVDTKKFYSIHQSKDNGRETAINQIEIENENLTSNKAVGVFEYDYGYIFLHENGGFSVQFDREYHLEEKLSECEKLLFNGWVKHEAREYSINQKIGI